VEQQSPNRSTDGAPMMSELPVLADDQLTDRGSRFTLRNRVMRILWQVVWATLFRPTPRLAYAWRNTLLRLFGARIGRRVHIMSSARIWAPWNLTMADHAAMGENVDCYCVAPVSIGRHTLVSQYSFLCSASHNHEVAGLPGFDAPIVIGDLAWVCADVFVGPGVTIGDGTVVGARSSVFGSLPEWVVAAGNPAKVIKKRVLRAAQKPGQPPTSEHNS
jgi:putative colanic acid biosynthesis acetyltransferase WcaF